MGSLSQSTNLATDNRLAVTDSAFGLSSSGNANNTALQGHILNIQNGSSSKMANSPKTATGSATNGDGGGGVNVNILDGGAIDKAFNFAGYSLSAVLDSVITGQKTQQAATQYTADTISAAIKTQTDAKAAAAEATGQNSATVKQVIIGLVVAGISYYLWKAK